MEQEADMNRFHSVMAGALVAGLLLGGVASAQGPRGGGPGGPPFGAAGDAGGRRGPGGRAGGPALALGALDLTDGQEQQIRDIRAQERDRMRQLDDRLRKAGEAQRGAIETVPLNEGAIRAATQALADVQADQAIQQAHVYNLIWAVLTPAQQSQAKSVRTQREGRRRNRNP
jgi:Spy/CpxP family protein refolding chaperone